MIDRAIIPQLEELHATLGRMCDGLEEYNNTLATEEAEDAFTDAEDEAYAWLVGAEQHIWNAWKHIGAAISALNKED